MLEFLGDLGYVQLLQILQIKLISDIKLEGTKETKRLSTTCNLDHIVFLVKCEAQLSE